MQASLASKGNQTQASALHVGSRAHEMLLSRTAAHPLATPLAKQARASASAPAKDGLPEGRRGVCMGR